jgi:hypothetical protein
MLGRGPGIRDSRSQQAIIDLICAHFVALTCTRVYFCRKNSLALVSAASASSYERGV